MTLTDFLLARIAEDEGEANHALAAVPIEHWSAPFVRAGIVESLHLARHHPARVLAECQAKRRIVDRHGVVLRGKNDTEQCFEDFLAYPCATLRDLALPYADHPDYDERWRP